jgi:hypothetical protein
MCERAFKLENHWLLEIRGYQFLAACRANETAGECKFDNKLPDPYTQSQLTNTHITHVARSHTSSQGK